MKKRMLQVTVVSLLLLTNCLPDIGYPIGVSPDDLLWSQRAALSQSSLNENFWIAQTNRYKELSNNDGDNIYWWNAHAAEVMVDGYLRSEDDFYLDRLFTLEATFYYQYIFFFSYLTTSYDDMLWLALAYQRADEVFNKPKFKFITNQLWTGTKKGWSNYPHGGGIYWSLVDQYFNTNKFKNTPSNAPASILAARLFQQNNNPIDTTWAIKIHNWQKNTLVDPNTGLVWDGITTSGVETNVYAYNQGTYIGENVELFKVTGNHDFIDEAVKTADHFITNYTINGILRIDDQGANGGLFKGIFVRYLTDLIIFGELDDAKENVYINFLKMNALSLWDNAREVDLNLFDGDWSGTTNVNWERTYLSDQLSGVIFMEMMAKLERQGLL